MLRGSIALGQRASIGSHASIIKARWSAAAAVQQRLLILQRGFADASKPSSTQKDSILNSDPAFLPGSQSAAANPNVPIPSGPVTEAPEGNPTRLTPSDPLAPPTNIPLTPPPPAPKVQTSPPTSVPPPSPPPAASSSSDSSPPPPPPPKRRRRLPRFLAYLLVTGGLAYGGGIWYALRSDNFHDFFTEYVPFGEEAVLYFEERAFQQRFPHARHQASRLLGSRPRDESGRVTIPSRSGLSWKVKEETPQGSDLSQKGPHMSAVVVEGPPKDSVQKQPAQEETPKKAVVAEKAKNEAQSGSKTTTLEQSASAGKEHAAKNEATPASTTPASPITQISPLTVDNADEPFVQELVKTVNDLITVINSDTGDAASKYSLPLEKAKESLSSIGTKIVSLKRSAEEDAKIKIEEAHKQFEEAAQNLVHRFDAARVEEAAAFREEFEKAREQLAQNYHHKVQLEVQRSNELAEARLKNEMKEQAIELKRKFISDVQGLVEKEREGRLSKLADLSSNVSKLQELTVGWNGVIDTNLSTQKLQVAVDAVRSTLERAASEDSRPRPFVRELAALKEVANGDPVVDAAIASINPLAYQRGLPSSHQVVDRFRRVASEVRKAALLPENAGVASHAASLLLSKVMFKKEGLAEGSDVESILTRTETLLEEGNLDAAAREMNGLHGWAKTLSKDWLADVRRILEVNQALEVIETEAHLQCLRVE